MTQTPWHGRIFYRATTTSTMDDAASLEAQGEPEGSLVWAGYQTAGRGRHPGRTWLGEPGASLMFTAWWSPARFRVPSFAPSLTVGLGLCLWLESLGCRDDFPIALKWPNDIYLANRKVAGVLVRQSWTSAGPGSVHAGIGVNLAIPVGLTDVRTAPISLGDAGLSLSPETALETLLPSLALALDHPNPRSECEKRLWKRNEELELSLPDAGSLPRRGTVRGLDESGRLVWDTASGREAVSSGE